jgi:hypothetical protein
MKYVIHAKCAAFMAMASSTTTTLRFQKLMPLLWGAYRKIPGESVCVNVNARFMKLAVLC